MRLLRCISPLLVAMAIIASNKFHFPLLVAGNFVEKCSPPTLKLRQMLNFTDQKAVPVETAFWVKFASGLVHDVRTCFEGLGRVFSVPSFALNG